MMRSTLPQTRLSILLACLTVCGAMRVAYPATITLDETTRYQTIEGWGASSNFWENKVAELPVAEREKAFDLVYGDLGFNILCIRLDADFQRAEGTPFNWESMRHQRMILDGALQRGRIDKIWVKVSSPPGWMKNNGDAAHGGHVTADHYQNYADYLSYYLRHMKSDYGIDIFGISIFNEPGYGNAKVHYESTDTPPVVYRDILKVVGETFKRDGLGHIQFLAAECSKITAADHGAYGRDYMPVLLGDPVARELIGRVTIHQYGDQMMLYNPANEPDDWERLREDCAAAGKAIWETEVYCGGKGVATDDIAEGLKTSLLIWTALTKGNVTAWHYWQYLHPWEADQNKSQGIVAIRRDGRGTLVFPRYYCMKQWAHSAPAGSVQIGAGSDDPRLYAAAFALGKQVTLVVFNLDEVDIPLTINYGQDGRIVEQRRTAAGENDEPIAGDWAAGRSFSVTIRGRSLNSFVIAPE